jgi:hypothetical protein
MLRQQKIDEARIKWFHVTAHATGPSIPSIGVVAGALTGSYIEDLLLNDPTDSLLPGRHDICRFERPLRRKGGRMGRGVLKSASLQSNGDDQRYNSRSEETPKLAARQLLVLFAIPPTSLASHSQEKDGSAEDPSPSAFGHVSIRCRTHNRQRQRHKNGPDVSSFVFHVRSLRA